MKSRSYIYTILLSALLVFALVVPTHAYASATNQANDDSATTNEGFSVAIDVLGNDYTNGVDVVIVTPPSHGTAVYDSVNQVVNYTPSPNYYGQDSFTYQVNDGSSLSNIATVNITINQITQPNQPPVAVPDQFTATENTPMILNVLSNDHDPENDHLSIVSIAGPQHGTTVLLPDQTILYTPFPNYVGPDPFSYTISDGYPHGTVSSTTATVSLQVNSFNHPPVAQADFPITNVNTQIQIPVLSNDYDSDSGDTISVTSVGTPSHGTAVINPDQTISYTPNTNYYGSDSFSYTISDNHGATASATVNVIVIGVNAPVITSPSVPLSTSNPTPTISGTSDPGATINLYEGSTLVGTTIADSTGQWSTMTYLLSDGSHAINAQAVGTGGLLSSLSNTANITVDTQNPTSTITTPDNSLFKTSNPTISGTASDSGSGVQQVQVQVDSGAFQTATGTTSWNINLSGLSDGLHTVTVQAVDNAGNVGATTSISINIDATNPIVQVSTPTNGQTVGINNPTISGTASDSGSGVQQVQVQVDSGAFQTATGTTSWNIATSGLSSGLHTITAKATDNAGNVGTTTSTFTVNTSLPNVVISSPANNAVVNSGSFTASGTALSLLGITSVQVQVDSGAFQTATGTTSWNINLSGLSDGLHTITAQATDTLGHKNTASITVKVDTTKPTITISSPANGATITTSSFTVTGSASDANLQKVDVSIDGGPFQTATGTTSWTTNVSGLGNGQHTITARATDSAGNIQTTSITITVQIPTPTNTPGKVTGGGNIGTKMNFGFEVQSHDGKYIKGHIEYHDKTNKIDLDSISVNSLSVDKSDKKATFGGIAKVNGKTGYTFSVYVEDNSKSGKFDVFSIKIFDSTGSQVYTESDKISGGNIVIHKTDDHDDDHDSDNDYNHK